MERAAPIKRFSLHEVMLPDSYSSFEEDVAACRDVGIGGLGISTRKLGQGRDEQLRQLLASSGLHASICSLAVVSVLPEIWYGGPTDPAERVELMAAGIERLASFGSQGVVALTGGGEGRPLNEARKIVISGFRDLGQQAAKHGMGIGIEPMRYPEGVSLISTLAQAAELVDEIGLANVGITFDVWHSWDSPRVIDEIAAFAHLIQSVHVADWRESSSEKTERALPGEGSIDLASLLYALEEAGFDGWYSLEAFSNPQFDDSFLHLDERSLLKRAWAGFAEAWETAATISHNPAAS